MILLDGQVYELYVSSSTATEQPLRTTVTCRGYQGGLLRRRCVVQKLEDGSHIHR